MRVQDDLINCEEEKLRVSKALIDLRIENNQMAERFESEKCAGGRQSRAASESAAHARVARFPCFPCFPS